MSISSRRTHFRSVSGVQPILLATDTIAAHCELCSRSCSSTIRTARSLTSGEYLPAVAITPSSQETKPLAIPGRFMVQENEKLLRRRLRGFAEIQSGSYHASGHTC